MRAAAERYIQTVEVPQQAAEQRARLRAGSFEVAQKSVIRALGTGLGEDAHATVGPLHTAHHNYVRLVVPENLKLDSLVGFIFSAASQWMTTPWRAYRSAASERGAKSVLRSAKSTKPGSGRR